MMGWVLARLCLTVVGAVLTAAEAPVVATTRPIDWPTGEPPSPAEVELGRTLFFDPRLSVTRTMSCATCHNPDLGFSDGLAKGVGAHGERVGRNAPSLYNLAWGTTFFWDGRAATLAEQALGPVTARGEMDLSAAELERRIAAVPWYRQRLGEVVSAPRIAAAIAAFEATLIVDDTPYDRWRRGDARAMSAEAQRGLAVFSGQGRCLTCHSGPDFTDGSFHNTGLRGDDRGRAAIVPGASLEGAFKTPGLRNVLLSAPYMHDGSLPTLEAVVEFYDRGGDRPADPLIRPLGLSLADKRDLVAFLASLTQVLNVPRPELP